MTKNIADACAGSAPNLRINSGIAAPVSVPTPIDVTIAKAKMTPSLEAS
jgi:hypothetical protein